MNLNKLVMYYHYTSLGTFLAILHGIDYNSGESVLKEIGPILHLHASRIDTVNDPTEMTIDKSTFLSIVRHYEENKNPKFRISNRIESMDDEKFLELIKNERSDYLPYIVCFSQNEDFLPMWSLYGDKGRGVCLGFFALDILTKSVPFQELINPCTPVIIGDVCYHTDEISDAILRAIELNYPKTEGNIEDSIANMYLAASPFIKDSSYEYENEFRICVFNFVKKEIGIMYDSEKTYIDYYIPVSFLKTVTLGAKLCSSIASELLSDYFTQKKLQIEIKKSQIPFR